MQDIGTPRAICERVLVRQEPRQDKIGSIYTPEGSEHYPQFGRVVSIGAKCRYPDFEVGDRVMFQREPASSLNQGTTEPDRVDGWDDLLALPLKNILMKVGEDVQ